MNLCFAFTYGDLSGARNTLQMKECLIFLYMHSCTKLCEATKNKTMHILKQNIRLYISVVSYYVHTTYDMHLHSMKKNFKLD